CGFVEASVGNKRGFPLVAFLDANVIIAPADIELGENLGVLDPSDYFGNQREWGTVLDADLVDPSVVLHRPECSLLILDEEKRSGNWRLGRSDTARFEMLIEEVVQGLLFSWSEGVHLSLPVRDVGLWIEIDRMVPLPPLGQFVKGGGLKHVGKVLKFGRE